jgi:hypothetical protein
VGSANAFETLDEFGVRRVEKKNSEVRLGSKCFDQWRKFFHTVPASHVDHNSEAIHAASLGGRDVDE